MGQAEPAPRSRNILLFLGDGMGPEQIRAAAMYEGGPRGTLPFESFPYRGTVSTQNAEGGVTDSAAAATAIATGARVSNGVVSVALPGDGRDLPTLLECLRAAGRSAGLVTTTGITHATPAAFGAHEASRENRASIAADYLRGSRPELLFGGAEYVDPPAAEGGGYRVVTDREGLLALNPEEVERVWGQFGEGDMPYEKDGLGGLPHLREMTGAAIRILGNDPDGFFLLVEGGRIDPACHDHDLEGAVLETLEFSRSVDEALRWAQGRDDTVILVTADHETGGLRLLRESGPGVLPEVAWETAGHTAREVPVYGWGAAAAEVSGSLRNDELFRILLRASGISPESSPCGGSR